MRTVLSSGVVYVSSGRRTTETWGRRKGLGGFPLIGVPVSWTQGLGRDHGTSGNTDGSPRFIRHHCQYPAYWVSPNREWNGIKQHQCKVNACANGSIRILNTHRGWGRIPPLRILQGPLRPSQTRSRVVSGRNLRIPRCLPLSTRLPFSFSIRDSTPRTLTHPVQRRGLPSGPINPRIRQDSPRPLDYSGHRPLREGPGSLPRGGVAHGGPTSPSTTTWSARRTRGPSSTPGASR